VTGSSPGPASLLGDGAALREIMALAGPDMAIRILEQMRTDLAGVAAALLPAISSCNWPTIRAQTHVLVALAGTIGAKRLHQLAIDANTAAHDQASARLADVAPLLLADLAALQALLGDKATGTGAGTGAAA
jgi:hypothetical protein